MKPRHNNLAIVVCTRNRSEALTGLLASLIGQSYRSWDLFLYLNGPDEIQGVSVINTRYIQWMRIQNNVQCVYLGDIGRSPAIAFNRAMTDLELEYEKVLFLDDDMWLPPNYIEKMVTSYLEVSCGTSDPFTLSGVTPWMDAAWPGIGPGVVEDLPDDDTTMIELVRGPGAFDTKTRDFEIVARQNVLYATGGNQEIRRSDALSPANFMMMPDVRIPWSDAGHPFVYADLAWCIQAKKLLGYSFWFDLDCVAVHVNAPSGGLRERDGEYSKEGEGKDAQEMRVSKLLKAEWPL